MPNTLAHIGVQGITTKSIFKFADLKWIYVGCIIPDLPWVLQRVLKITNLFNLYDVRDYCIILLYYFKRSPIAILQQLQKSFFYTFFQLFISFIA